MQFFGTEILKELTKTSSTTARLESGSEIRIGGQLYRLNSDIDLDINTDLDVGTPSVKKVYYVYAVANFGSVSLKYSLSSTSPSGYQAFKKIGALYINGTVIGIDWTATLAAQDNSWESIIYGNGLFVAVSNSGTNRVMTSPDGITWTVRTAAQANNWQSITYGNGLFVAVSADGTNRVMTSPDGITWTARNAAQANTWSSVTYGNNLFVAVSSGGTNRVMTSPDGITWTVRNAAQANSWTSVTYGNNLFVAVSSDGTNRVMTSPDGITWTARTAAEANSWRNITYGGGLFVAVAVSGTNRIMTSPDGITWTARAATEANNWRSVTYGDGLFVAVSTDGTNRIMTSPDAITWTARTAAEANQWQTVTYGNNTFVALAASGLRRVMTSTDYSLMSGASSRDDGKIGDIVHSDLSEELFIQEHGAGWVLYDGRSIVGTRYAELTGKSNLADARGMVIRGKNNGRNDGYQDPDGERTLGHFQEDTLQNITGTFQVGAEFSGSSTGAFTDFANSFRNGGQATSGRNFQFDASRVARTSTETRSKNLAENIFIKIENIGL